MNRTEARICFGCVDCVVRDPTLINSPENGVSVCLFGSAARSSTDLLSDRDVLVTARSFKTVHPYIQELGSKGYSVAPFSHARLQRMVPAGSLFVQHLKMEGKIIQDTEHWLEDCLGNFSPSKIPTKKTSINHLTLSALWSD